MLKKGGKMSNIEVGEIRNGFAIVKNIRENKYVKLGERELRYLQELLRKDMEENSFDVMNENELSIDEKDFMRGKFMEWGFIENEEIKNRGRKKKLDEKNDLSKIRLVSMDPERFFSNVPIGIKKMFSLQGEISIFIFSFLVLLVLALQFQEVGKSIMKMGVDISFYIILWTLSFFSTIFHELGHAFSCSYYGGKVTSMGIMLFYFFPTLYCDVSDIYFMNEKKEQISVSIAGIMANLLFGNIVISVYFLLNALFMIDLPVILLFYIVNLISAFINFFPFLKLDGYWLLVGLSGITNLMEKSTVLFLAIIYRKFIPRGAVDRSNILMAFYGGLTFFLRPCFWIYTIYILMSYLKMTSLNKSMIFVVGALLTFFTIIGEFRFCKKQLKYFKGNHQRVLQSLK